MTLACTVDATGISAPSFATVLQTLTASAQAIFGADAYLEPDGQDGQLIAIVALAVSDANGSSIAAYNNYSPATAQGNGLSSAVKINGLTRAVPSPSQVLQQVVGTVGTVINDGIVLDSNNLAWTLPATVVIPAAGAITVTATCTALGAVVAAVGSITGIGTPTLGWLSTTNTSSASATLGAPVETDGLLRIRQARSTAVPAQTIMEALTGKLAALPGVTRLQPYENDTELPDGNGLPPHSIALVVEGGDAGAVAAAIAAGKAPGCTTVGSTSEVVVDAYGVPRTIRWYPPTVVPITVAVTVQALPGYTSTTTAAIAAAVAASINALPIGTPVYLGRLYTPANLPGNAVNGTYDILSLAIGRDGAAPAASNLRIAFNEAASCVPANVTVTVTT